MKVFQTDTAKLKFGGYLPSNFPHFEQMIAQFCFFAISHMMDVFKMSSVQCS